MHAIHDSLSLPFGESILKSTVATATVDIISPAVGNNEQCCRSRKQKSKGANLAQ